MNQIIYPKIRRNYTLPLIILCTLNFLNVLHFQRNIKFDVNLDGKKMEPREKDLIAHILNVLKTNKLHFIMLNYIP